MKSRSYNFPNFKMSYKVFSILILFAILGTTSSGNSNIVYGGFAKDKDVRSLHSITVKEALPLVLFLPKGGPFFRYPVGLDKAAINKDGRLITGTEFYPFLVTSFPQIFFCPDQNASENCLIVKKFEESQVIKCDLEPIPSIAESSPKSLCGFGRTGSMWSISYEICPSEKSYAFYYRNVVIYSFCYDTSAKKILFTDHYLLSVKLSYEKLLEKERKIKLELRKDTYKIIDQQYYNFLDNTAKEKTKYKFQKLVPTDNMALATWRKTTYQYLNIGLQHRELFNLWDEINTNIRTNAKESGLDTPRRIMTGVFDIPNHKLPESKDNNQMYNVWITMVIDLNDDPSKGKVNLNPIHGIAFLMNNFIQKNNKSISSPYIDEICGESFCVDTLIKKFVKVGGEVRCCKVTRRIHDLFWGENDAIEQFDLLEIRDITSIQTPV